VTLTLPITTAEKFKLTQHKTNLYLVSILSAQGDLYRDVTKLSVVADRYR